AARRLLGPGVLDHRGQALRLGHRPGGHEPVSELLGRFLDRRRFERQQHVIGLEHVGQLHSRSLSSGTTSAGRFITAIPARARASILSLAVPEAPEMIAPAWPMRRPGAARWPAADPTTGLDICLAYSAACCSSVPPISRIITTASVSPSASQAERQWMKLVPMIGSPPMPTQVDWPNR